MLLSGPKLLPPEVEVGVTSEVVLVLDMLIDRAVVASTKRAANCGNAGGEVTSGAARAVKVLVCVARTAKAPNASD